jgi:ring-1,2-phenylacetyl-CoA epoxidase subunit PaaC
MTDATTGTGTTSAADAASLPAEVRSATADLILAVADSKRLLGMRYAQWLLGAPELEAGIACASMAQDEWGHARLLYALLRDFGHDTDHLEHARPAAEYRAMETLDAEPESWTALVALNTLVDSALTCQLQALGESAYLPLRQRVQKLIDEETFHAAHGEAWFRRITASGDHGRTAMRDAAAAVLPDVLRWFGPDSQRACTLHDAGVTSAAGTALRARFLHRVGPLLALLDSPAAAAGAAAEAAAAPDFTGFDETMRRRTGGAPDERTIEQVRGDRNRAFLMD